MDIAIKVPNRTAEIVSQAIIKALKKRFPEDMVKTITFDTAEKEFAGYKDIENALHCSTSTSAIHTVPGSKRNKMKTPMDC